MSYEERNNDYIKVSLVDPAEIPINLTTLKSWLRLDTSDTSEDTILQLMVDQAVRTFETISRRTLMFTNFQTFRNCWACHYELRKSKLQSITSVKYNDEDDVEQTVSSSDYFIVSSSAYSSVKFVSDFQEPELSDRPQSIIIDFVGGLAGTTITVPSDIQIALMEQVAFLYENRGDCACDDLKSIPAQSLATYRSYQIIEIGA